MSKIGVVGKWKKRKGRGFPEVKKEGVEILHALVGCSIAFGKITTIVTEILKIII